MGLFARFPRLAAWVIVLALLGMGTLCALQGLRMLEPDAPPRLEHVHGVIVAMRGDDEFAVRAPGHTGTIWFRVAHGAPISLAHVQRHLQEHAPTDVYYQDQQGDMPLAWIAD